MGNRFLRIFDTRGVYRVYLVTFYSVCVRVCVDGGAQTRPVQVANHKAILGLSVSPSLPHQLASFAEVILSLSYIICVHIIMYIYTIYVHILFLLICRVPLCSYGTFATLGNQ